MSRLILIRHATSEWNAKGIWTGWTDIGLAENVDQQIAFLASHIHDIPIHHAYSSLLKRARETLRLLGEKLHLSAPITHHAELNERHYGVYTGKNKWAVKEEVGEEEFTKIRRSWNHPIPEGETLEEVHNRIVPFYKRTIQPRLKAGENVLVVAHGNSLRALIKHLEGLTPEEMLVREVRIGEVHLYSVGADGTIQGGEVRGTSQVG